MLMLYQNILQKFEVAQILSSCRWDMSDLVLSYTIRHNTARGHTEYESLGSRHLFVLLSFVLIVCKLLRPTEVAAKPDKFSSLLKVITYAISGAPTQVQALYMPAWIIDAEVETVPVEGSTEVCDMDPP